MSSETRSESPICLDYTFDHYLLRIKHNSFWDIALLSKNFRFNSHVKLTFKNESTGVMINDLTGNGPNFGKQNRGYGTLLVNTMLLYLRHLNFDPNTKVYGVTSSINDPIDDKHFYEWNRRKFWGSFGFSVEECDLTSRANIYSTLGNLKVKNNKLIDNIHSSVVDINCFIPVYKNIPIDHW